MKHLVLILLLISSNFVFSQSAKKDIISVSYVQLPLLPLEKEMANYKLDLINNTQLDILENNLTEIGKIHGFNYDVNSPDFIVKIKLNAIKHDSFVKKKMGTESYNFTVTSSLKVQKKIYSLYDEGIFYEDVISNNPAFSVEKTSKNLFANEDEAKKALKQNLESYKKANSELLKVKLLEIIGEELNSLHGYPTKKLDFPVWTIKPKQFEYKKLDEASITFQKAITEYSKLGLTESVQNLMRSCINVWQVEINTLDPSNKKARISVKNVSGLYLNIAQANIWLNEFELAQNFIEESKDYKGGSMYATILENLNTSLKERFAKDALRKSGDLNIKKVLPKTYSKQFIPKNNGWRLKTVTDYYGKGEQREREKRDYNYDRDVVVFFDGDIIERNYAYDNDSLIAHVYDSREKQLAKYYIKDGTPYQVILFERAGYEGNRVAKTFKINYDDAGKLLGYQKIDGFEKMKINYENDKINEVMIKRKSNKERDTSHYIINYKYHYVNNLLVSIDRVQEGKDDLKYSISHNSSGLINNVNLRSRSSESYTYDENGNLIEKLKGNDTSVERFTYDWEKAVGNLALFKWRAFIKSDNPPFVYQD